MNLVRIFLCTFLCAVLLNNALGGPLSSLNIVLKSESLEARPHNLEEYSKYLRYSQCSNCNKWARTTEDHQRRYASQGSIKTADNDFNQNYDETSNIPPPIFDIVEGISKETNENLPSIETKTKPPPFYDSAYDITEETKEIFPSIEIKTKPPPINDIVDDIAEQTNEIFSSIETKTKPPPFYDTTDDVTDETNELFPSIEIKTKSPPIYDVADDIAEETNEIFSSIETKTKPPPIYDIVDDIAEQTNEIFSSIETKTKPPPFYDTTDDITEEANELFPSIEIKTKSPPIYDVADDFAEETNQIFSSIETKTKPPPIYDIAEDFTKKSNELYPSIETKTKPDNDYDHTDKETNNIPPPVINITVDFSKETNEVSPPIEIITETNYEETNDNPLPIYDIAEVTEKTNEVLPSVETETESSKRKPIFENLFNFAERFEIAKKAVAEFIKTIKVKNNKVVKVKQKTTVAPPVVELIKEEVDHYIDDNSSKAELELNDKIPQHIDDVLLPIDPITKDTENSDFVVYNINSNAKPSDFEEAITTIDHDQKIKNVFPPTNYIPELIDILSHSNSATESDEDDTISNIDTLHVNSIGRANYPTQFSNSAVVAPFGNINREETKNIILKVNLVR